MTVAVLLCISICLFDYASDIAASFCLARRRSSNFSTSAGVSRKSSVSAVRMVMPESSPTTEFTWKVENDSTMKPANSTTDMTTKPPPEVLSAKRMASTGARPRAARVQERGDQMDGVVDHLSLCHRGDDGGGEPDLAHEHAPHAEGEQRGQYVGHQADEPELHRAEGEHQ